MRRALYIVINAASEIVTVLILAGIVALWLASP